MATAPDRYVLLQSGLAVPLEPVLLVLDLETRGFQVIREGEENILVRPARGLTDADKRALARWKPHILALVAYCDREVVQ